MQVESKLFSNTVQKFLEKQYLTNSKYKKIILVYSININFLFFRNFSNITLSFLLFWKL